MTETAGSRFASCAARYTALAVRLAGLGILFVLIFTSTVVLEGSGG